MAVVLILILIMIGVGIIMNLGFKFFSWIFKNHFASHSENQVLAIKQDAAEQEGILSKFTGGCRSVVTNLFSPSQERRKIDEAMKELQKAVAEYNKLMNDITTYAAQYNIAAAKRNDEYKTIIKKLKAEVVESEAAVKELSVTDVVEPVISQKTELIRKRKKYGEEVSVQSIQHDRLEELLYLSDDFFSTINIEYKCIKERTAYVRDRTRDLLEHHQVGIELDKLCMEDTLLSLEEAKQLLKSRQEKRFSFTGCI
jgi:hypothetical protein